MQPWPKSCDPQALQLLLPLAYGRCGRGKLGRVGPKPCPSVSAPAASPAQTGYNPTGVFQEYNPHSYRTAFPDIRHLYSAKFQPCVEVAWKSGVQKSLTNTVVARLETFR